MRPFERSPQSGSRRRQSALPDRTRFWLPGWKGDRGVPSHVMAKLLRRLLREHDLALPSTTAPAALRRASDALYEIWARAGHAADARRHPTWQLVEAVLRLALDHLRADRSQPSERPSQIQSDSHIPRFFPSGFPANSQTSTPTRSRRRARTETVCTLPVRRGQPRRSGCSISVIAGPRNNRKCACRWNHSEG